MDDFVTVEYRGIVGTLVVGATVVVESCDAGVLRLRAILPTPPYVAPVDLAKDSAVSVVAPEKADQPS